MSAKTTVLTLVGWIVSRIDGSKMALVNKVQYLLSLFPLSGQIQQSINNGQRMGRIAMNVRVVTVSFSQLPESN